MTPQAGPSFNPHEKLITMRGRGGQGPQEYLEVKWRICWLRDTHPTAHIRTELVTVTDTSALFKATVILPHGGGSATGYGSETANDFRDFIEKA